MKRVGVGEEKKSSQTERLISDMKNENTMLREENDQLRAENASLQKENDQLRAEVAPVQPNKKADKAEK